MVALFSSKDDLCATEYTMTDPVADAVIEAYQTYLAQYARSVADAISALPRELAMLVASYSTVHADAFHTSICDGWQVAYAPCSWASIYVTDYGLAIAVWSGGINWPFKLICSEYMSHLEAACGYFHIQWLTPDVLAGELAGSYAAAAQNMICMLLGIS